MNRVAFFGLLAVLLLGAFLRFYDLRAVPIGLYPDEAMNGTNAQEALATGHFKIFYPENNGREGLFINIQAVSLALFGSTPWALRVVSALLGTLTILGVYLVTKELFYNFQFSIFNFQAISPDAMLKRLPTNTWRDLLKIENDTVIALVASFFIATSYWHLNFSRIGFRAIMVAFFATFGLYFLLRGLRRKTIIDITLAGIFIGLGFHTYIAFRFMPFVIAMPLLVVLRRWWREQKSEVAVSPTLKNWRIISCVPYGAVLFLLITFAAALPIGWYFFQHPGDFIGRGGQVSIFAAESPLKEFIKSNALTLQMFFWQGDCNWRHNFACKPALHPLVALFFVMGVALTTRALFVRRAKSISVEGMSANATPFLSRDHALLLIAWFGFMTLPATLTREGMPHALRSIGLIPPVMILAGFGAWSLFARMRLWLMRQTVLFPQSSLQLRRVRNEIIILFFAALIAIAWSTYRDYFIRWSENKNTYFAFAADLFHQAEYMRALPQDTQKIIVVNLPGVEVRGIPMPSQPMMFLTDTFRLSNRIVKNFHYVLPHELSSLEVSRDNTSDIVITFLNGFDRPALQAAQKQFLYFRALAPGDFTILKREK